jgi:hypothetical protein
MYLALLNSENPKWNYQVEGKERREGGRDGRHREWGKREDKYPNRSDN